MGKKYPYYGKSMITNFPGFPHTMGFVAFSCTMANWWENLCVFHMMKYTIEWESDGKKTSILWEKYDYQFPRFSPYDGFCCIFSYYGKLTGKLMDFPYDEVYHKMGKNYPYYGKSMITNFQGFPIHGFCWIFSYYGKLMGKPVYFPYVEIYQRMGIKWEKSTHTMGKVW